jgi:hypothetical protein
MYADEVCLTALMKGKAHNNESQKFIAAFFGLRTLAKLLILVKSASKSPASVNNNYSGFGWLT